MWRLFELDYESGGKLWNLSEGVNLLSRRVVIARLDKVKAWRLGRSGFCVAKMCYEPLGEVKTTKARA